MPDPEWGPALKKNRLGPYYGTEKECKPMVVMVAKDEDIEKQPECERLTSSEKADLPESV